MVSVSPPFVLYVPEQFEQTKAHECVDCNSTRKKMPHSFHVRIPVILNNYLGSTCVKVWSVKVLDYFVSFVLVLNYN